MTRPDDSALSPQEYARVRKEAERLLRAAGALGRFPTPVGVIMDAGQVTLSHEDVLNEGFLHSMRRKASGALKSALSKVLGLFDAHDRLVFIDRAVKAAKQVTLYPGAVETLRMLRARGLRIGLVTNNGHAGTEITLRRCQLTTFFDAIVTRDDCEEMKPDGGPVRKLLKEMNVLPEEAILVGDGVIDIMAARATGLLSVAVATGPFPSGRLIQAEPDFLLGSVNDLPLLIERLAVTGQGQNRAM